MQPIVLFISIAIFFVAALTITNFIQKKRGVNEKSKMPPPTIDLNPEGCCGMHQVCTKGAGHLFISKKPEYFDDEELDRFHNRDSSNYSEKEAEEFREVFDTILENERADWISSLRLREIAIPDQLKDELLLSKQTYS